MAILHKTIQESLRERISIIAVFTIICMSWGTAITEAWWLDDAIGEIKSIAHDTAQGYEIIDQKIDELADDTVTGYEIMFPNPPTPHHLSTKKEIGKAAAAAGAGAATGYGVVTITGMSAIGMVGSGAGFGAAAGPVGAVAGAIAGLAAYGVYRIFE